MARVVFTLCAVLLCGAFLAGLQAPLPTFAARPTPTPYAPIVINFTVIPASRAAAIMRSIYPDATVTVDSHANALVVVAPGYEEDGMRTIASGIDVKNPTDTTVDTYQTHALPPQTAATRLAAVYPAARFVVAPNRNLIIMASPADMAQIKAILASVDTAPPTAPPRPPAEAVRVTQRNAKEIARVVAAQEPDVRVMVSHSEILLSGPPEDVEHAKTLIAELDVPQMGTQYTQLYRIKYVDATSVADLLRRSFPNLPLQVNADLNAITITSNLTTQRRVADALTQLDTPPPGAPGAGDNAGTAAAGVDVVHLRAAVPGLQGGPSTSAADIATTVLQALQASAPDLKITVPPNSTELVLTGSPYSIKVARELIQKLDVQPVMVALDTEVLEVDEGVMKNLGLQFPTGSVTTTLTEVQPLYPSGNSVPGAGQPIPYLNLMPLVRSPIQLTAQINFLIQNNKARILEDPRLTTVSGRTASLRAGETLNILTTTGGGTGTVATTQVQSFQTGVTLDITPVVNENDYITVTLHPSVNSAVSFNSQTGVPNIQTRDTTTTVGLHDGETLVIGGLIEDVDTRTTQKIPILGDIPLIGPLLFTNHQVNHSRNELVVTVTPHIVRPGESGAIGTSSLGVPRPEGLPTLPPGTQLPPPRRDAENEQPPQEQAPPAPAPEPQPVSVPTPASYSAVSNTPPPGGVAPPAAPRMQTAVAQTAAQPQPSAFAQTNVYTFGAAPQNNYAAPNAAPQIFYVQVTPSVLHNGDQMSLSVITSTNVAKLSFGPNAVIPMANLQSVGPGQWQASFNFSSAGLPIGQSSVSVVLTAVTGNGATVSLPVPISLLGP